MTVREEGERRATPLLLALSAVVFADIAFAIDSVPAALAITRETLVIWVANGFALVGLLALLTLLDDLLRSFRYLDETIGVILAFVGIKLLLGGARPHRGSRHTRGDRRRTRGRHRCVTRGRPAGS